MRYDTVEAFVFYGRDQKVYVAMWDGALWSVWGVSTVPVYHGARRQG